MAISVSKLVVYPVKSMAGIDLAEAELTATGFRHDRHWMVIDDDNRFLTQRQHPEMALVTAVPDYDGLTLSFPGGDVLRVPLVRDNLHDAGSAGTARSVIVTVWGGEVAAVDQGVDAAEMLTRFLNRPARLVYISERNPRPLGSSYPSPKGINVGFADSAPLHLVGEASLQDLNNRLEHPVAMDRFRPNIVIAGSEAFAEDRWQRVRVGSVTLLVVKACIRCQMVNVNQHSGVKGIDPLETLGGYRSGPKGTRFGQKVVHEYPGVIRRGDTVHILEEKQ